MKNKICKISLFSAILASVATLPSDARVNTNNSSRSYADAYNQVNAMRYQQEYLNATATNATTASATANLPVMVADETLASEILSGKSETTVAHLENCAMVYPNGVFRWDIPESGIRRNQTNQCVAVISLIDANTNAVLATTTLATGDSFKCNIDYFPQSGMNAAALAKTELPADIAPTMEDVEKVMNEEQKQNAGFKIAAGAIISAVAGNMLAPKEAGDTKLFGTSKTQLMDTAIGAAAGAGVMAASSYSGKVAGDTIKSTAVNAASGMIVGNMLAGATGGDSYLEIQECNISDSASGYTGTHDCIAGKAETQGDSIYKDNTDKIYIINSLREVKVCEQDATNQQIVKNCNPYNSGIVKIMLEGANNGTSRSFDYIFGPTVKDSEFQYLTRYHQTSDNSVERFEKYEGSQLDNTYYKIAEAYKAENAQRAYIVFETSLPKNIKGYKKSDFTELESHSHKYFDRDNSGEIGRLISIPENKTVIFTPLSKDAEDGGLVDINNKARVKGTLVGTAAGGALGGFAGYQGAQTEITNRWTEAVRAYEDSLSNFVCMTGNRYLSKYNDYVQIPTMKEIGK